MLGAFCRPWGPRMRDRLATDLASLAFAKRCGLPPSLLRHKKLPRVCGRVGRNHACLEKDVQPWVGSTDPIPITMCITLTL